MFIDKKILPNTKDERWKYTNIAKIYQKNAIEQILKESEHSKDYLSGFKFDTNENVIVILDGVLAIDYNKKLTHVSKLEFNQDKRDMSNLAIENAKTLGINIPKDTKESLNLIFINTTNAKNKLTNLAIKLNIDMFSKLDLDIDFVNLASDNTALNLLLDIDLAESAKLTLTNNSENANNNGLFVTANYLVNLDKNAELNGFTISHKDSLLRHDFVINLNKENSRFDMRGLYLLAQDTVADVCFLVNHNASDTYSNINYRGVLNDSSKAWFNAKAIVNKDIQRIQAYQNNKNIQLNKKSELNTKPELEIYSDDVVCTHGATIGELDKEALFYLQSRGLSFKDAQHLLLESFVKSLITAEDLSLSNEYKEDIVEMLDEVILSIV